MTRWIPPLLCWTWLFACSLGGGPDGPCPEGQKQCGDGVCRECCSPYDCPADESCDGEGECVQSEDWILGQPCSAADRSPCFGYICDPTLLVCVRPCEDDLDCVASHPDLPFGGDLVCQADGACGFARCSSDGDCRPGYVCFDGDCVHAPSCDHFAACRVAPASAVTRSGSTARLAATAYLVSGARAPGVGFTWTSSDEGVASVSEGLVTGGPETGSATITAASTGCSLTCAATVRNYAPAAGGLRVVAVDELTGAPLAGVTAQVQGVGAGATDGDGVALFAGVDLTAAPADVTLSAHGVEPVSFMRADRNDLLVPLRASPDPGRAGGRRGVVDFSHVICEPGNPCEVKVALTGASLPGNPVHWDLAKALGHPIQTHIELGGTSEDVPLPSGVVLGLNDTWFSDSFWFQAVPGVRVAWALGGKLNLADLIEVLGPVITGEEPFPWDRLLLAFGRESEGFYTGLVPNQEVEAIDTLPDSWDLDGDGDTGELVPDFGSFPDMGEAGMVLKVPFDQVTTVSVQPLPADGAGGYRYDTVLCVAGVLVVDAGFVPLGVGAGIDSTSGEDAPDGIVAPIGLHASDVAGRLADGSYQRVIACLALTADELFDQGPAAVAGQVHLVDAFGGSLALRPFMDAPVHAFDPSTRSVNLDSLPAGLDALVMIGRQARRSWQILHPPGDGQIDLPPEPVGGEPLDSLDLAALRLRDGLTYSDLIAFDEATLTDLVRLVSDFALVADEQRWPDHSDAPLPIAYHNHITDCQPHEPPSWELWAGRANAVVVGTVVRVEPLLAPAKVMVADCGCIETAQECTGLLEIGLRVGLERVTTLFGAPVGDALELTFGNTVAGDQCPSPTIDQDGALVWRDVLCEGNRIEPGQRIGGAMFQDPDAGQFWGPQLAGILFQVDAGGIVHEQDYRNRDCYAPFPIGLDGMPLTALRDLLPRLDLSDPDLQEELANWATWGGTPCQHISGYWGAQCFETEECSLP